MATIMMEQNMYIDLPRPKDADDGYDEARQAVARVRVLDSARGAGEMIGWLQYQADDVEGWVQPEGYRLPDHEEQYVPDLGAWLAARSGVARRDWEDMLVQEDVWKAVIARFLEGGLPAPGGGPESHERKRR